MGANNVITRNADTLDGLHSSSLTLKSEWTDGWISAGETWAYASATTITVPTGAASKYQKGDWIKLTQTTVKYFKILAVADTLLTVTAGTTHTVADAVISANYYSHMGNPMGVPRYFAWTPVWSLTGGTLTTTYTTQLGKFMIGNGMITWWFAMTLATVSTATATKAFQVNCPISDSYFETGSVTNTGSCGTARYYDDSGGLQNAGFINYYTTNLFRMVGETQDNGSASVGINPNITLATADRWGGSVCLPMA